MTLAEFLLARIAEDEAAAEDCAKLFPSPWEIADRGWRVRIYSADVPLSEDVGEPGDERTPCVIEVEPTYAHDGWLSDTVEHIARHDPARVLAECAAKRCIVGQHETQPDGTCIVCRYAAPCVTVSALAAVYRDHEDWREEWA